MSEIDPLLTASVAGLLHITEALLDATHQMVDVVESGRPMTSEMVQTLRSQENACREGLTMIRRTLAELMAPDTGTIQ